MPAELTRPTALRDRLAAWWVTPARSLHAYAIAAAIGLLAYLIVYGPGHMFGTSAYWGLPQEDSRAYLMGYRYFLHEPWHWPVFVTHTMNVPYGKSIAFSDAVPIFALLNKAIATVIPPWGTFTERSYLGLWHALLYVLQPCFGVAILRQLGQRSRGAAIVTALFFLAVPSWILRYAHAALAAQFLLLSALYLYLRAPTRSIAPLRLQLVWLCQLAVAALVNPYHVVISLGFFAAALLKSRRWQTIAWFPLGVAMSGLALAFGSYFSHEAQIHMGGFDMASTNMLSMFVPTRSGIFGDASWLPSADATGLQYEGMTYLGLGTLSLLVLFLPRFRSVGTAIKRHPFLFAFVLGSWLLALSTRIYFGSHLVVGYELPHALRWVSDQFRSPGRFAWVAMYVAIAWLTRWGLARFTTGWQLAIMPLLAIVQLVDASGAWRFQHSYTQDTFAHFLPIDAWRPFVHAHDAVFAAPSYDCIQTETLPHLDHVALEIEFYASQRALPINGVYSARPTRDCGVDELSWRSIVPQDNTLYVVLPHAVRVATRLAALGATCARFEYGQVCTKNTAALADAIRSGALAPVEPPATPGVAFGTPIETAHDSPVIGEGWSFAEPSGRWSDGPIASLIFHLTGDLPASPALEISAAAALCGKRTSQDVDVILDGELLSTLHFGAANNDVAQVRSIPIAHPELLRRPLLVLDFKPHDLRSPMKLRCNGDPRELGIRVAHVSFE